MSKKAKLADLKASPKNPRRITEEKIEMLKKSFKAFGSLSGVVLNRRSGNLVGGTQTSKAFADSEIEIVTKYKKPTAKGTVAEGFVVIEGERHPFRMVDWDSPMEFAANIAANKGAGKWNYSLLGDLVLELDALNFDLNLTMFDKAEIENLMAPRIKAQTKETAIRDSAPTSATLTVKCKPDDKDAVLMYLKRKFLEVSFEGIEIQEEE